MLDPENRHLLTDALRPPAGSTVDAALATTYTLDLRSVLLAPLAMASYDQSDGADVDAASPIALLESIRRHASHTTVLCQAAGMQVPPTYPRLAAFAEGMVAEVQPPAGRTFHPKIWVLRFVDSDGQRRHRFACLSRNLTGDRSWDTVLICDEDPEASPSLDGSPVATFITETLDRVVRPLTDDRRGSVLELCEGLAKARLAVPAPFASARAVPLGTPSGVGWPLPENASTWAVISPFLESSAVKRLPRSTGRRLILSRADTLDRLGSRALGGAESVVMQAVADRVAPDEDQDQVGSGALVRGSVPRGLHAKVFAWEDDEQAHVLTGSANCTRAAFDGNIEMSVLLSGPKSACGVDALLGNDRNGLLRLTQSHHVVNAEPTEDPGYVLERRVEDWHAALAASRPTLRVEVSDPDYVLHLEVKLPEDEHGLGATTTVKPVGMGVARHRPIRDSPSWRNASLLALCPYLVVTTSAEIDGIEVTRSCVLLCAVEGAPDDRHNALLRELLSRQQDILRYLVLLLGDLGAGELIDRLAQDDEDPKDNEKPGGPFGRGFDDLVLLEPLVRAAARGDDSLIRAHRLLEDLRDENKNLPQLDDSFLELWQTVWEAST